MMRHVGYDVYDFVCYLQFSLWDCPTVERKEAYSGDDVLAAKFLFLSRSVGVLLSFLNVEIFCKLAFP